MISTQKTKTQKVSNGREIHQKLPKSTVISKQPKSVFLLISRPGKGSIQIFCKWGRIVWNSA